MNNATLIRKKIDWVTLRCSETSLARSTLTLLEQYFDGFNLVREKEKLLRDDYYRIGIRPHKSAFFIDFEGQFFDEESDFHIFRDVLKRLNQLTTPNQPTLKNHFKITRIDIASDFLNAEPRDFIPNFEHNNEWQTNFGFKSNTIVSGKTREVETAYVSTRFWQLRAYRKDIQIKTKQNQRKVFYDLNNSEYKGKNITRLELELHSDAAMPANHLLNSETEILEEKFCESILKEFTKKKKLGKKKQFKKSDKSNRTYYKWTELHQTWQYLESGSKIHSEKTIFQKSPLDPEKWISRMTKGISSSSRKHEKSLLKPLKHLLALSEFSAEELQEFLEVVKDKQLKENPAYQIQNHLQPKNKK